MSNIRGKLKGREEPSQRRLPKEEEEWNEPPPFHDWVVPETPVPQVPDEPGQSDGEDNYLDGEGVGEEPVNENEDEALDGAENVEDGELLEDSDAIDGEETEQTPVHTGDEDTADGYMAENEQESLSEDDAKLSNFARVGYVIGVSPSADQEQRTSLTYMSDLEESMDRLAAQVGETIGVEVHLPSIVDSILGTGT